MTAATLTTPVYIHMEASSFYITGDADANGDRFHCWDEDRAFCRSVFTWEQLLTALRTDSRFEGRKSFPLF